MVFLGRVPLDGRWGGRQHLAARLARTRRVVYVEDPVRDLGAAFRGRRGALPGGLLRIAPWEVPLQRFGTLRRLSVSLARDGIRGLLGDAQRPLVAVLYSRCPLDLVAALRPDGVLYHAIDDYSVLHDGSPDVPFLEWEGRALATADVTVAITAPLGQRLAASARGRVEVQPLGYDEEAFVAAPPAPPPPLAGLPRPILGFVGTLTAERMDIGTLEAVSRAFPGGTLLFAGDEIESPEGGLARLRALPNARLLGFRPREEVPGIVRALDVALCPYRDTAINRHCYPLKVVDALAAGRPVVYSPARGDLQELAPLARFVGPREEFVAAVRDALSEGSPPALEERRRTAVRALSWEVLAERFAAAAGEAVRGRNRS
jgi:glycosyltransferase involved in cell wall biosynthesis